MSNLKTKVKDEEINDSFVTPEWKERLSRYGSLFLQGAAFSLGGIATSKVVETISNRRVQQQIHNSDNVIEFKEAINS